MFDLSQIWEEDGLYSKNHFEFYEVVLCTVLKKKSWDKVINFIDGSCSKNQESNFMAACKLIWFERHSLEIAVKDRIEVESDVIENL